MRRIAVIDATDLVLKALSQEKATYQCFNPQNIHELNTLNFEGLVIPGQLSLTAELTKIIQEFHADSKPVCAIGEAVYIIARTLGKEGVTLAGSETEKTGAYYESCAADDFVTDREHKIITTPGDEKGIRLAISELVEMA